MQPGYDALGFISCTGKATRRHQIKSKSMLHLLLVDGLPRTGYMPMIVDSCACD